MSSPGRFAAGAFTLVNGAVAIGVMTAAAAITGEPFIFPSLGPTVFLLYADPLSAPASPRNTIAGQAIGIALGYASLVMLGLTNADVELGEGITARRVAAAAIALGLTSGVMVWSGLVHPPAAATTLLVALGVLRTGADLAVLMLAVVLVVIQAIVVNRLAGLPYPLWSPGRDAAPGTGWGARMRS